MVFECLNCRRNSTAADFCSLCGERIVPKETEAPAITGGQLTSPLADIIKRAMEGKATQGVVSEARKKYDERLKGATDEVIVVADLSGSMHESIGGLSVTKYHHLKIALDDIRKNYPKVRVVVFNSTHQEWKQGKLPAPGGGTDLASALYFAGQWKPRKTIVISDGLPDNEEDAKAAALALTGVVDTIYCGPDGHPAIDFLRSLSERTCGTPIAWNGMRTELAANIRGLLA